MDVFKSVETRWRMLVMVLIWFVTGVVYYGISLNVVNLGFNVYASVFVNGLIELPAFAGTASLLGRMGRRAILVSAMALSGVCCLLGNFVFLLSPTQIGSDASRGRGGTSGGGSSGKGIAQLQAEKGDSGDAVMGVFRLSCGVLGIFGMARTYNLIYIHTMELFPIVVRNAALGLAAQAAGVGLVVAPFIVVMGLTAPFLPFLMFGVLALVGAGLSRQPASS